MRTSLRVGAAVALLALAAPAKAQFGAPFGAPGMLTTPEIVSGAIGAGAAHSAAQPQCTTTYAGRGGPQSVCTPAPTPEVKPKR